MDYNFRLDHPKRVGVKNGKIFAYVRKNFVEMRNYNTIKIYFIKLFY